MKRTRPATLLVIGCLALTGCGHATSRSGQPSTTCGSCGERNAANVRGAFRMVGGPYPGVNRPLSGTISIHKDDRNGRVVETVRTAEPGKFATFLPPGRYWFEGTSADVTGVGCPNVHTVTVTHTGTAHVQVVCAVP